ncbi:dienelactone hydrolase family protein [Nemorincola caseinilytica]|uniref:Dienelactone hydrolase family protein n=2 Tax=Nemorincola caseinilytica TaxID=2054315 RepID=A0ABP8N984_9BACT
MSIVTEEVSYKCNGATMKSYVIYDASRQDARPAIVVVPEWWGLNGYTKMRARMLAELGYVAIAADMYGDGKTAKDPQMAKEYAMPFYKDPKLGKECIAAAIAKVKEYPQTDKSKIGAVGFCFGGSMVLNAAKMGMDLKVVVSFHGGLQTVPAKKGSVKGKILVCHGGADKFVSDTDILSFRKNLDTLGVPYQFISYPGATHAFTNPQATAVGKKYSMPIEYNDEAAKKSWGDMKKFLSDLF